jgi:DNA-binding transcriptional regulator YiaG
MTGGGAHGGGLQCGIRPYSPHETLRRRSKGLRRFLRLRGRKAEEAEMITGEQVRAARTLLAWSQDKLAAHANLTGSTVSAIERNKAGWESAAMVIHRTLQKAGVEFPEGEPVRMRNVKAQPIPLDKLDASNDE